jgi:hypothetical protein
MGTHGLHRYFGHMNILQPKRIAFPRLPPGAMHGDIDVKFEIWAL